jgi:hypothetical protein
MELLGIPHVYLDIFAIESEVKCAVQEVQLTVDYEK